MKLKTLVLHKHGQAPEAVLTGTDDEIGVLTDNLRLLQIDRSLYVDKENPMKLGRAFRLFDFQTSSYEYYRVVDADTFTKKQNKTMLPETLVPNEGGNWSGGAWTIAFVYSNRGNFVLKGYYNEVQKKLRSMIGLKYFMNLSLWNSGMHRSFWDMSERGMYMSEPSKRNGWKWEFRTNSLDHTNKFIRFKRLPKKWIPEIEQLTMSS